MRYMVSRQVQKLSAGSVWRSAKPAIARWNACECRFGMPGSCQPADVCDNNGVAIGMAHCQRLAAGTPTWRIAVVQRTPWSAKRTPRLPAAFPADQRRRRHRGVALPACDTAIERAGADEAEPVGPGGACLH